MSPNCNCVTSGIVEYFSTFLIEPWDKLLETPTPIQNPKNSQTQTFEKSKFQLLLIVPQTNFDRYISSLQGHLN